jgi:hypothetical protein
MSIGLIIKTGSRVEGGGFVYISLWELSPPVSLPKRGSFNFFHLSFFNTFFTSIMFKKSCSLDQIELTNPKGRAVVAFIAFHI